MTTMGGGSAGIIMDLIIWFTLIVQVMSFLIQLVG